MAPENDLLGSLALRGIDRRRFLKFCSAMVSTLAVPPKYVGQVAHALANTKRPVLAWLQFSDCAGNSESMLRSSHPSVGDVVLELLSWEYHELIMAGAGKQAEATLKRIVQENRGKYIAVVEGAIPLADGGVYCTIGGRTAVEIASEVCAGAVGRATRCRRLELRDHVSRHRDYSEGPRSARSLDLGTAHLRCLHYGSRPGLRAIVENALQIEVPDNARIVRNRLS